MGGSDAGNQAARFIGWPKLVPFLRQGLASPTVPAPATTAL